MERLLTTICVLVVPGIWFIVFHMNLLRGKGDKGFYMANHIYAGRAYLGIPFGVTLLVWALATIPQSVEIAVVLLWIGVGFAALGIIFNFIHPSFLKPSWFKQLEHEHRDIMLLLKREANQMGLNIWNERIQTQADLERWVAEVRQKYEV